jgi:phosphoribosylformylglycinamidine cyclo-ligase
MLATHRSYLASLKPVLRQISAMAHITGGGIPGNLDRALPKTVDAVVEVGSWTVPNVFVMLEHAGSVDRSEMFRTFNMGVGMIVISDPGGVDEIVASARSAGVEAWTLGHTAAGSGRVILS